MLTNRSERIVNQVLIPAILNLGGTVPQQARIGSFEDYQFELLSSFVTALINAVSIPTALQVNAEPAGIMAAHCAFADLHSQYATDYDLAGHTGAASPHSGHATTASLSNHTGNTNNPHATTAAQVGAEPAGAVAAHAALADPHPLYATDADLATHAGAASPHSGHATNTALTNHTGNTNNPHSTTAAQVGAEPAGAVAVHAAIGSNVHGLPASVNFLGNRNAPGEFVQRGSATASGSLGTLALAQYREIAVTFPAAFAAPPKVFCTSVSGYPAAVTTVSATGCTIRVFGELSFASSTVVNYLAIGA